jgi:methylated-DNA-[protein]-cysteine S-methyltransferase
MDLVYRFVDSPVGQLKLVASAKGLVAVLWENDRPRRVPLPEELGDGEESQILRSAEEQLRQYFAGERREFDLPLDMRGTEFQQRVWEALLAIPYGETTTYGRLASKLGDPNAVRAVGAANGRNPLSIVVPCHRVIGSTGKLTGFAGGLETKAHLLQLEQGQAFSLRP